MIKTKKVAETAAKAIDFEGGISAMLVADINETNENPQNDIITPKNFADKAKKGFVSIGGLQLANINYTCTKARAEKDLDWLVPGMWQEQTILEIFGRTGSCKTIYGVQLANELAKKEPVLYFDYELQDKGFQQRYTNKENGITFTFSNNLYRITPDTNIKALDEADESWIDETFNKVGGVPTDEIKAIGKVIKATDAKIVFIDNVSAICGDDTDAKQISGVIGCLYGYVKRYKVSVCLICHTPKVSKFHELDVNDVRGSSAFSAFVDFVAGVGFSLRDKNERYIKLCKVRYDETPDNVTTYRITKEYDGLLHLVNTGVCEELALIQKGELEKAIKAEAKAQKQSEEDELKEKVLSLYKEGKTQQQIAVMLDVNLSKVKRIPKATATTNKDLN